MSLPKGDEYLAAIQHPRLVLRDSDLAATTIESRNGLPKPYSGGFTMTFHAKSERGEWAIRCFTREVRDLATRYQAIDRFTKQSTDSMFAKACLLPEEILVKGRRYDVIKMEWIRAPQLDTYIRDRFSNPSAMRALSDNLMMLGQRLAAMGAAHGDLQHGNVLVDSNGMIKLVDYDDFYLPELSGLGYSSGLGHPNYQHPERASHHFGPSLDSFSLCSLYVSALAIANDASLWNDFDGGDDCFLFRRADFLDPGKSAIFQRLATMREVSPWVDKFAAVCSGNYDAIPSLSDFLDGRFSYGRYAGNFRSAAQTTPIPPPGSQTSPSGASQSSSKAFGPLPFGASPFGPFAAAQPPPGAQSQRSGPHPTGLSGAPPWYGAGPPQPGANAQGFQASPQTHYSPLPAFATPRPTSPWRVPMVILSVFAICLCIVFAMASKTPKSRQIIARGNFTPAPSDRTHSGNSNLSAIATPADTSLSTPASDEVLIAPIAAFYQDINNRDFSAAYALLSPKYKASATLSQFEQGYVTTESVEITRNVRLPEGGSRIEVDLLARDSINGAEVTTVYNGSYDLVRGDDGAWLIDDGHFASHRSAIAAPSPTGSPEIDRTATATEEPSETPASATEKPACDTPNQDAAVVNKVDPEFPDVARQGGASGTVKVQVNLSETGSVVSVSVYQSSGNVALDESAMAAARQSSYQPEIVDCIKSAKSYLFVAQFEAQ